MKDGKNAKREEASLMEIICRLTAFADEFPVEICEEEEEEEDNKDVDNVVCCEFSILSAF